MKNFDEKKLHILNEIKLSSLEKAEIRDSLTHFMASHPLPRIQKNMWFKKIAYIPSPYTGISLRMTKVLVFSLIAVIGIGSGLTFASASAIPGELLYPIKINIKEEIEGSLKTKPEEKLVWKEKKVTRRIEEIKILKSQKQITKREATIAQAVLQKHVAELKETFDELKDENKDAILATTAQLIPHGEETTLPVVTEETSKITTLTTTEEVPLTNETIIPETLSTENTLDGIEGDDTDKLKEALTQEINKQIQEIKNSAELVAKDTTPENLDEIKTEGGETKVPETTGVSHTQTTPEVTPPTTTLKKVPLPVSKTTPKK